MTTPPDFENKVASDNAERVVLHTFATRNAADLAASQLEGHGIKCWLDADNCGGWLPYLTAPGGVRLSVLATDVEAAAALLAAEPAPPTEVAELKPASPTPATRKRFGSVFYISIVVGLLLCLFFNASNQPRTKPYLRDANGDGRADKMTTYENDGRSHFSKDRNFDGAWDYWADYDAHHACTAARADNNFDGKPDVWWTLSNDETVSAAFDTDFNGEPDVFSAYTHGVITQSEVRPNHAAFAITKNIYAHGVLTEIWRGGDANGHFQEVVRYDAFMNPISTNSTFNLLTAPPKS